MRRPSPPCPPRRGELGSTAAEFGLVLPVLLLFLFGVIDAGRYMWMLNEAEKATQMGARMAAVTDMIPGGLFAQDYSVSLGQGQPIPTTSFGTASCTKPAGTVSCSCTVTPCPTLTPVNSTAFNNIVTRMRWFLPEVAASNVTVDYANSGLGYAGDPNGSDVAPLITVTLRNVSFRPAILLGTSVTLPDITASLTSEDGAGTTSN